MHSTDVHGRSNPNAYLTKDARNTYVHEEYVSYRCREFRIIRAPDSAFSCDAAMAPSARLVGVSTTA